MKIFKVIALAGAIFLCSSFQSLAADLSIISGEPEMTSAVQLYQYKEGSYNLEHSFLAFDADFLGGASIALADLGGDGIMEIIAGAGPGGKPEVRIYRTDGSLINVFYAYSESFNKGVQVAGGDVNGDGKDEIITGTYNGGGPHVRIFDGYGSPLNLGWFAYAYTSRGGVNIAAGDVNGDGKDEIITGSGLNSAPEVKVFNAKGKNLNLSFIPFAVTDVGGVSVAAGDVNKDGKAEIIMGIQSSGEAWIKVYQYNPQKNILGEFQAWDSSYRGGINLASGDINADGNAEIVASIHGGGGPQLRFFNVNGSEALTNFFAYAETFQGGVNAAVGNLDKDAALELVVAPTHLAPTGRTDLDKYIYISLAEQRLYAYEHGYLKNTFLISSGLPKTPTPPGDYKIFNRYYSHLYSGPDYYLPNTLYNMEFKQHFYLHGAYWHHNFGHPMSHGCINIDYPDAKWVWEWSAIGTPVFIH